MGILWLVVGAALAQSTPAGGPAPLVELAAGHEGSSYFRWAAEFGSEVPGMRLLIQPTAGSAANVAQLVAGRVDLALAQSDVAWHAWAGTGRVPADPDIVAVGQIMPELVHLIVAADSPVAAVGDLSGLLVDVGAVGSGTLLNALDVLAAAGVDDATLDFSGAFPLPRVERGVLDAAFVTAPTSWDPLAEAEGVRLVPIELDELAAAPYYELVPLPEAYGEGSTVQVRALLVCGAQVGAAVVEALLDTGRFSADGVSIPLHPAAEAWFSSRGAVLPEPAIGYEPAPLPLLPPMTTEESSDGVAPRYLRVTDLVESALAENPSLKLALLSRQRAELAVSSSGQAFVPWLELGTAASQAGGESGWDDALRVGIDTPVGTTVEVGLDASSSALDPSADWIGLTEIALSHPLLDGGGLDANLASLRRARLDARIADATVEDAAIDLVTDVAKTYFDVAEAYARVALREDQVDLATRHLNRVRAQASLGEEDALSVEEALHAERSAENELLGERRALRDAEDALLDYVQARFSFHVVPLGDLESLAASAAREGDTLQKRLVSAVMRRPDLRIDAVDLERARVDLAEARNGALPSLSLDGGVGRAGAARPTIAGAASEAVSAGEPFWDAGVTLELPLGRGADPIEHERARIAVKQRELELEDKAEAVTREVRAAWRAADTSRRQLDVSQDAAAIADRKLSLAIDAFRAGEATSFMVVSYQEDYLNSRLEALSAAVDYLQALAELDRVSGTSLDGYRASFDAVEVPIP